MTTIFGSGRRSGTLASLLLLGLFALSGIFLTLIGAQVYVSVREDVQRDHALQSSCSYLTSRVHGCAGTISASETEGVGDVLMLEEEMGGDLYLTRIYLWDGNLSESFLPASAEFDPDSGEKLVEAAGFSVSEDGALLRFEVTFSGQDGHDTWSFSARKGAGQ